MPEKVVATNENIKKLVDDAIRKYGLSCDLNFIDVSQVTDMSNLFLNSRFAGDISGWNVSRVTNMMAMFSYSQFDGNISHWNVSNVTDMSSMFKGSLFKGNISEWTVSRVTNMISLMVISVVGMYPMLRICL